jgi:diketogulonate reductase-like aldo/keto reductase
MSMHTIYILMKDGDVVSMSPSLSADEAVRYFQNQWLKPNSYDPLGGEKVTGQVYACHMSQTAAKEVWDAFKTHNKKTPASVLVKRYSSYMNHCADVT